MNNLKEIRISKGISQFELAKMANIAPSDISRLENNKVHPYPNWRKRISKALGLDEGEIWTEIKK